MARRPRRRDALSWARGWGWGFAILYDLRFSSDTKMWWEEITRAEARPVSPRARLLERGLERRTRGSPSHSIFCVRSNASGRELCECALIGR